MKFAIRFAEKIVGFFILVAVIGILAVIIVLGANQRWFAKNYYFKTYFQSGSGISRGMSIIFKGFEIGKVADITMNEKDEVVVHFYIYDSYYSKVKINSVIQLASNPLGSSLLFYPGRSKSAPLDEFSTIPALNSEEGKTISSFKLAEIPDQAGDSISLILKNVDEITSELNTFLKNNADKLSSIVDSLNTTSSALTGIMTGTYTTGPVAEIFFQIASTVRNLERMTTEIDGLIPRLLDPSGGKEIYPTILTTLQNIENTTADLKKFSEYILGTRPQISGLLEQGREALSLGKDVLEGISNNPLIRGGISQKEQAPSTLRSFRDEAF